MATNGQPGEPDRGPEGGDDRGPEGGEGRGPEGGDGRGPDGGDDEVARGVRSRDDEAALAPAFDAMWARLAEVGRDPSGGYLRLAYDDAELTLREWFAGEAASRSMRLHEDRAGNLWAWWGDPAARDAVVTGSHLDSVRRGGAFDGPLGVVSAFLAIDRIRARGVRPRRPIAVVAFADEEGARFGVACAGSRLLTGLLDPAAALALRGDDGLSMAAALRRTGRDPHHLGPDAEVVRSIGRFVELHVEQGRGLIDVGAPVAVGAGIRPHGRWRFDLEGRPDHAGTTLLQDRDDPMLVQARLVLAAREAAEQTSWEDPFTVATVGRVKVQPNSVNAIPSRVQAWLDVRADAEPTVRAVVERVAAEVGVAAVEESWTPRVDLDAGFGRRVADVVARRYGPAVPFLDTGAGHDAGILATAGIPSAMLFVRNPTGVSHAPAEHAERDDCLAGVVALADVLTDLACR
jgi:beta-ureidopropionase / N-carbamoyl-L-amino-acid hydrolase